MSCKLNIIRNFGFTIAGSDFFYTLSTSYFSIEHFYRDQLYHIKM